MASTLNWLQAITCISCERVSRRRADGERSKQRTFSVCQPVSAVCVRTEMEPSEDAAARARPSSCGAKDSAFTEAWCAVLQYAYSPAHRTSPSCRRLTDLWTPLPGISQLPLRALPSNAAGGQRPGRRTQPTLSCGHARSGPGGRASPRSDTTDNASIPVHCTACAAGRWLLGRGTTAEMLQMIGTLRHTCAQLPSGPSFQMITR